MQALGATFSGPDIVALTRSLLDTFAYPKTPPTGLLENLASRPVAANWRKRLLAPELDDMTVEWGDRQIGRGTTAVSATLECAFHAPTVLEALAGLPFELAVLANVHDEWSEADYRAPAIGPEHALLGWGMIFKGAAHEHSIVSRRWLAYGPFRTLAGAHDTTLVQCHDLSADGATALQQARHGHEWITAGLLRAKHRFKHDIQGIYTKEDRLLRIVVNDREVSPREMLDACVARRDGRDAREKPIENIAYVFVDERAAEAHLERLWLHGLECRYAGPSGERRLDTAYQPTVAKPDWVATAS